ncbi:hypothetical protein KC318_g8333 [Hortaea werneckii]|nr:hypothetical protein KC334_g8482 [Hortaea werneckii]KAI7005113.1 hypothetical protein KC355_g8365 [Hortaea werneckii]KAI7663389.1 hypothetical protein KC318_g8333 [Hortaea werneckii]
MPAPAPPARGQHLAPGQQPSAPKPKPIPAPKARPVMPPRQKTAPTGYAGLSFMEPRQNPNNQQPSVRFPSFNARALDLASEIGDNKFGPSGLDAVAGGISGFPASFSEHFLRERELERRREEERRRGEEEEKGMVNRIMLARMHTLEEGFREVLREIKDLSSQKATGSSGSRGGGGGGSEGEVGAGAGGGMGYPAPVASSSAAANLGRSHSRPSMQQGVQSTSTSRISDVLEPRTPVRSRLGGVTTTTTKDGSNKATKKSPRKSQLQQTRRAAAPPAAAETSTSTTTTGKGKEPAREEGSTTTGGSAYEESDVPSPESVIGPSVVEDDAKDGAAAERPGTAIHSPAARDSSRRVGEE